MKVSRGKQAGPGSWEVGSEREAMGTTLVCGCGRQLRVTEHHAGRRIQCPGCGAGHTVTVAMLASTTTGPIVPSREPSRKMQGLVVALLAVLLGASVLVGGWYVLWGRGGKKGEGEITERALIPDDVESFLSIRLASLWQTRAVQKAREEAKKRDPQTPDFAERWERETSLRPEEVERVTILAMDGQRQVGWAVVRTREQYDAAKVLAKLPEREKRYLEGWTYYVGRDGLGQEGAVWLVSPRLLVVGPEEGIRLCLTRVAEGNGVSARRRLASVLAKWEEGYQVLGGIGISEEMREVFRRNAMFAPLANTQLGQLTVEVGEEAVVQARAQTENAEQAQQLQGSIQGWRTTARLFLTGQVLFGNAEKKKAAQQLIELLGKLEIKSGDKEVVASVKTDAEAVAAVLLLLPGLLGR